MGNCSNWGSTCRRLRCPATCHGGAVRPRKAGALSCGTRPLGVGMISFGEAGRLPDQLLSLVSGWIERIVRYATKVRDGLPSALTALLGTLRPGSSRSANCNRRAIAGACIPIYPRSTPSRRAHWMMTDRRPSPYRSRASPRLELRHTRPSARSSSRTSRWRRRNRLTEASTQVMVRACFCRHADKRATPDGSRRKTTLRRLAPCNPNAWIKF